MKQSRFSHWTGPVAAALLPLGLYLLLRVAGHWDIAVVAPLFHFYIVSAAAVLAALAAAAVGLTGIRQRNLQVIFLALSFLSLALVFGLHGLSTPGFLLPPSRLPGVAAQLSLVLTALWLWCSVLPSDHRLVALLARGQNLLLPVWSGVLLLAAGLAMVRPDWVAGWIPVDQAPLRGLVAGATVLTIGLVGRQYWQSHRYSQFPLQKAMAYAAGWLAAAQIILTTGELWRVSWWIYHFLLVGAMALLLLGLVLQYSSGTGLAAAVRNLLLTDPVARLRDGLSSSVRSLVAAAEARDPYTAGHNIRVALSAVRLGAAMGLPPEQLRALAQGGMVHDIGKLAVPDQILNKPGPLTPEERRVIERHPVTGYEFCRRLGFMQEELAVIRSHHERWDGKGYPDGLAGTAIPHLARIVAVCDVYDALTSSRSYRRAWSHEAARQYILEQSGNQFDPGCVAVWARVAEAGPLVSAAEVMDWLPGGGDAGGRDAGGSSGSGPGGSGSRDSEPGPGGDNPSAPGESPLATVAAAGADSEAAPLAGAGRRTRPGPDA